VTVQEVLRQIEARGLNITAAGADLRLTGRRERMDPELIGLIRANKAALIAHLDAPGAFPLTELQRGYLVGRGDALEMGNVASHVYHEIEGAWDLDRLEAALRRVVARHGMLRTRFTADGRQVEEAAADVRIERLDLRGQSEAAQHDRRMRLREERSHRVLPADRAPLLAAEATILAGDRMVLHVSHDGLAMDAISMFLFFRAWWSAYACDDAPGDDGPEAPFAAYVRSLEEARGRAPARRAREHWLARLDDLAPHPNLPLARNPSEITRPRFTPLFARLDRPAWAALKERAAGAGLTPSGLLFAAYAETLAHWGAGPRFTINFTVANRPPIHPRILDAIGNFGETMLVEVASDRRTSFAERARALQAQLRRDLDNRHFSGIEVMRELARRRGAAEARMPYTFNSALGYPLGDVDGSAVELFGPEVYTVSQTPQVWLDVTAIEQHGGVVVEFDSVDGLHPEGLVEALADGYRRLLEALLDEAAWSARTYDLLPAEQRARRREANDTARTFQPEPGMLPEAFLAAAERAPDAPAIVTGQATMGYGELRRRALHAAAWLREQGVARDELVGLVMRRGLEQLVAILATVIAGAAYLPIEVTLPAERQRHMLADGRVRRVLTNVAGLDTGGRDTAVLRLDASRPAPAGEPAAVPPLAGATPDDLAYVLYTSGTTGVPKGVMVSHRSVANVVADCNARFGVGPGDRFFGISAFNFDLSVYDVFGALSAGAAVVLPDADQASDPAHWLHLCGAAGVTVWNSVPAIVSLLRDQAQADGADALAALRLVMMSGDRIPPTLPAALRGLKPGLEVVSLGGPTETTIWNVLHPVGADEDGTRSIPYGRPNANNRAYILDDAGTDMPDWVTGEICAAGAGLARGYWGDEALTAERFARDPDRGERIYRTGDLGRYLRNGEIDILGRRDFQIKVHGYRIEAGEVETRLVALDAVRQAAVVAQAGERGDRLVAHLVPSGDERPADAAVREALRRRLPEYMVPSAIVWHDGGLPLTRNGKVDRARLVAAPAAAEPPGTAGAEPDSELEREVAGLWAAVLKTDVGATGNLYDLGGDSLAAARILTAVRRRYGVSIPLDRLPEVETVRAMAARIAAVEAGAATEEPA
jgi:pyochelin synthetase